MVKTPEPLSSSTSSSFAVSKQVAAWPWPYYCHHRPRTLSFRIPDDVFKTINSAYILDTVSAAASSLSSPSPSSSPPPPPVDAAAAATDVSIESVIRLARSDRIFFDPGTTSSSIINETSSSWLPAQWTVPETPNDIIDVKDEDNEETAAIFPYSDSVFLSVDSRDPVLDFRKSMEEMVAAHGLKDWDRLEELLQWYLKVNDEGNHSYVYGAFLDLLVSREFKSANPGETNSSSSSGKCSADSLPAGGQPCGRNYSPSSPLSFDTSSSSGSSASSSSLSMRCVSGLETEDYDKEQCSVISSSSS